MVLNTESRARLADALSRRQGALEAAGASAPPVPINAAPVVPSFAPLTPITVASQAPSASIVVVPLTIVQASPTPAPSARNEGVMRAVVATTCHSTTMGRPASFRDNLPSASSPHGLLALEGGGESAPALEQTPSASKLPAVLHHALKGFQRGAA